MKKVLIAYYSRKGQNWVNGEIQDLEVGNTQAFAEILKSEVGKIKGIDGKKVSVTTFKIVPTTIYPASYNDCTLVAKKELEENAFPPLKADKSILSYDTIFIGFPCWWSTMPRCIATFLRGKDFTGKTVIPFVTHEGSGLGTSMFDMKKYCKNANLKEGVAIKGSTVLTATDKVKELIEKALEE